MHSSRRENKNHKTRRSEAASHCTSSFALLHSARAKYAHPSKRDIPVKRLDHVCSLRYQFHSTHTRHTGSRFLRNHLLQAQVHSPAEKTGVLANGEGQNKTRPTTTNSRLLGEVGAGRQNRGRGFIIMVMEANAPESDASSGSIAFKHRGAFPGLVTSVQIAWKRTTGQNRHRIH